MKVISIPRIIVLVIATLLFSSQAFADRYSNVSINGRVLTLSELYGLQQKIGTVIAPGYYLVDNNTGCWLNQSNGNRGCLGNNTRNYQSNQGSGAYDRNGNWNHYDSNSRWGVGGTGDGCIYTPDWSNC